MPIRTLIVLFWLFIIGAFIAWPSFSFFTNHRRSINVCAWLGMFDLKYIEAFEQQTGIKVNISYYESNEELLLKLGSYRHGYDLIVPSDYTVYLLRQQNMLKPLDKGKLTFYHDLNPVVCGHYFDPQNDYSIPYEWAVFGLGINTECYTDFDREAVSWDLIFNATSSRKVIMTNDLLVAIPIARLYLYPLIDNHAKKKQVKRITKLLMRQYPLVEAYSDFRASYYLASKNGCIAVASSSAILMSMREYPHIDFVIPKEGSVATIESFALPASTSKDSLVYAFLNFIMSPQSVAHTYTTLGYFPTTLAPLKLIDMDPKTRALLTMTKQEFERFTLVRYDRIRTVLTHQELQDLSIAIKA